MDEELFFEKLPEFNLNNIVIRGHRIASDIYELIIKASVKKIDLYPYLDRYFNDYEKLYQIYLGLSQKLDISVYDNPRFSGFAMNAIREALFLGLNTAYFVNTKLNDAQLKTLIDLEAQGIDIRKLNNSKIKEPEMRYIGARCLEGYDMEIFLNSEELPYCLDKLKMIKKLKDIGFDLSSINIGTFQAQQLREIYKGVLSKIDYVRYFSSDIDYKTMEMMRNCMELGICIPEKEETESSTDYFSKLQELQKERISTFDYLERDLCTFLGTDYADKYDKAQIYQLKKAIILGYNLTALTEKPFTAEQMEELIFGLEDGLDITKYNDISLSDIEMSKIRNALKSQKDDTEDISELIKSSFPKKNHTNITNLKKSPLSGNKNIGIDKKGAIFTSYICLNEENIKLFEAKKNSTEDFIANLKTILNDLEILEDEELLDAIKILQNNINII